MIGLQHLDHVGVQLLGVLLRCCLCAGMVCMCVLLVHCCFSLFVASALAEVSEDTDRVYQHP